MQKALDRKQSYVEQKMKPRNPRTVQGLGLCTTTAKGMGSIPVRELTFHKPHGLTELKKKKTQKTLKEKDEIHDE